MVSKPLTQKIQDDECNLSSSSYNLRNKKNHDNEHQFIIVVLELATQKENQENELRSSS